MANDSAKRSLAGLRPSTPQVIDAGLVAIHDQMAVLVDHRGPSPLGRMLAVDQDAASQLGDECIHPGDCRGKILVEDPQADIRLQNVAEIDDRLVAQSQTTPLLDGRVLGQFRHVDAIGKPDLGRVVLDGIGRHHPFESAIILREPLELLDRPAEFAVLGLHLLGDGAEVWLQVDVGLVGPDELVDRPPVVRRQLENLFRLGRACALLDGNQSGAATPEMLRRLVLRHTPGLPGFDEPLTEGLRVDEGKIEHVASPRLDLFAGDRRGEEVCPKPTL